MCWIVLHLNCVGGVLVQMLKLPRPSSGSPNYGGGKLSFLDDQPLFPVPQKENWLSWIWWVKCILRYIAPSEGVEQTTKTQRTQRSIDPM